jgi:hypothetical protein
VGYRGASGEHAVAFLEVPVDLVGDAIAGRDPIKISMSYKGEVGTSVTQMTVPLDELVQALLRPDALRMEEPTRAELMLLLERLQRSLEAVKSTIGLLGA